MMFRNRIFALPLALALASIACDQRAAAADPRVAGPPVPERIGDAVDDTATTDTVPT